MKSSIIKRENHTSFFAKPVLSYAYMAAAFITLNVLPAQAADWSSTNVQLLNGSGFELGEDSRTIFTLENATGWKYGDTFFFIDVTEPTSDGTESYAEFSPRFSFSKISGSDLSFGFVKDIMLSTTFEMGEGVNTTLVGVGLPLDIPGFAFANINLYVRDSHRDFAEEQTDTGGQVTLTWNRPFSIGTSKWNFEGFFDYAFGEDSGSDPKEDNIITAPRIMLNLGENVQAGVEYQIWENKFGVDGVDEDVVQAMVKWIF